VQPWVVALLEAAQRLRGDVGRNAGQRVGHVCRIRGRPAGAPRFRLWANGVRLGVRGYAGRHHDDDLRATGRCRAFHTEPRRSGGRARRRGQRRVRGGRFDGTAPQGSVGRHVLGHPLHPALTDVPVGAWTVALALDLLASGAVRRSRSASDCWAPWRRGFRPYGLGRNVRQTTATGRRACSGQRHGHAVVARRRICCAVAPTPWPSVCDDRVRSGLARRAVRRRPLARLADRRNHAHNTDAPDDDVEFAALTDIPGRRDEARRREGLPGVARAARERCLRARSAVRARRRPARRGTLEGDIVRCPWHGSQFWRPRWQHRQRSPAFPQPGVQGSRSGERVLLAGPATPSGRKGARARVDDETIVPRTTPSGAPRSAHRRPRRSSHRVGGVHWRRSCGPFTDRLPIRSRSGPLQLPGKAVARLPQHHTGPSVGRALLDEGSGKRPRPGKARRLDREWGRENTANAASAVVERSVVRTRMMVVASEKT